MTIFHEICTIVTMEVAGKLTHPKGVNETCFESSFHNHKAEENGHTKSKRATVVVVKTLES